MDYKMFAMKNLKQFVAQKALSGNMNRKLDI